MDDDSVSNLPSLSDEELVALADRLIQSERELSNQRRILQGKSDILRAELVHRLRKRRGGDWTWPPEIGPPR